MNKTLVILALALAAPMSFADPAPDFTALVAKTKDAVVSIEVESRVSAPSTINGFPPEIFEDFFGFPDPFGQQFEAPREQRILQGQGSGFIIDSDGYILTNAHVVEGAEKVRVQLNNNKEYNADVIGLDKRTDVALVKIQGDHLPVAKIGDSDQVQVGDWVLAIGSPFGFSHTATQGIVSAVARNLPSGDYVPFIQTDAAINPGNSGGPLFNLRGQVVGVNSQIYSQSGGFMGISFAIPIDVAMNVADQLRRNGKVERGRIGVVIQEVNYDLAKSFGLEAANGALISQVTPGGPADKAGLQPGDIVQSVNGENVKASSDLPVLVGMMPPGTQLTLGIWRNGKREEVQVTLGSSNTGSADAGNQSGSATNADNGSGFTSEPTGLQLRSQGQGLLVLQVEGAAQQAGLRRGDIILMVNRTAVSDENSFNQALNHADRTVALLVQRGNSKLFLALELHR